jgi:hypothetical protein
MDVIIDALIYLNLCPILQIEFKIFHLYLYTITGILFVHSFLFVLKL